MQYPAETIHDMIKRFDQFKDEEDGMVLTQCIWHDTRDDGKTYACALGAFFGTYQASNIYHRRRCAGDHAPDWLMELTPQIFDTNYSYHNGTDIDNSGFHIRWAAAVYGTDGLIDRASVLSSEERIAAFEAAEQRLLACKELNTEDTSNVLYIATGADKHMKLASTIVAVLDDELVKRGA